jgi:cbb3-type cytochrome oxidase subunit 3
LLALLLLLLIVWWTMFSGRKNGELDAKNLHEDHPDQTDKQP